MNSASDRENRLKTCYYSLLQQDFPYQAGNSFLEKVNHETLKVLLRSVEDLGLPIVATVSDKQSCVKKALEEMWPDMPHQWCQPHYLGNLADPVYEQDRKLKAEMRQTIRGEV